MRENAEFLKKIIFYMNDFRDKEKPVSINFMDKGALLRTNKDNKGYYVKFDTTYWILAGQETGRFKGAGFALNTHYYNIVHQNKLDILYTNLPNYVYYYKYENYEKNSFNHIQKFNDERVRVIAIVLADEVWKV